MTRVGSNYEVGDEDHSIHEDHISVHPPQKGESITIKHTIRFNGMLKENVVVANLDPDRCFSWHAQVPTFRQDSPAFVPAQGEEIVELPGMDVMTGNIVLGLMVAGASATRPDGFLLFNTLGLRFDRFQIFLGFLYFDMPATPAGWTVNMLTSSPRWNGGETFRVGGYQKGESFDGAARAMRALMDAAVGGFAASMARLLVRSPYGDISDQPPPVLTAVPPPPLDFGTYSDQDLAQGRLALHDGPLTALAALEAEMRRRSLDSFCDV